MKPNNTLATFLLNKKIVLNAQQANTVSTMIFTIVLVICGIILIRSLFFADAVDPKYYYDPSQDIEDDVAAAQRNS